MGGAAFPLYFDDLVLGTVYDSPSATVTEDAIVRFGLEWDFQPFHVSAEAARATMFGGLIASGLHTIVLTFRLYNELGVMRGTAICGVGLDKVQWLAPVRPGDTLRVRTTVVALKPSSKPHRGLVVQRFETFNQAGAAVLSAEISSFVRRRPPAG